MHIVEKLDLFEDESLRDVMLKYSWYLLVAGMIVAGVWAFILALVGLVDSPFLLDEIRETGLFVWLALFAVGLALSFVVHEGIHGLFFWLLGPRGAHVGFGYNASLAALYATAPNIVYGWVAFLVILLAPSVCVSVLCMAASMIFDAGLLWLLIFVVHLSGCAGDVLFAREILNYCKAGNICIMDTEVGITIFECEAGDKKLPFVMEA